MAPYLPKDGDAEDDRYDPPIPTYDEAVSGGSNGHGGLMPSPSTFDPLSPMGEAFYAPENENGSLLRRPHRRNASTASDVAAGADAAAPNRLHVRSRAGGYRPPTVETDDEDSTWSSTDSDAGHGGHGGRGDSMHGDDDDVATETAHVRREMMELEMEDPLDRSNQHGWRGRPSIFGKGFSISLPTWARKWRWSMPRIRIRLPDGSQGSPSLTSRLGRFTRLSDGRDDGGDNSTNAPVPSGATGTEGASSATARRRCWPDRLKFNAGTTFVVFGRLFAVLIVLGFVYLLFMSDLFTNLSRRLGNQVFDPESIRMHIQASVDAGKMRDMVKHFSSYAHVAGTEGDFALAIDVKNLFAKYGLEDVTVDEYYVYLNYPTADGRAVEILDADGHATWTAKLEEDNAGGNTAKHQTYAFHGLSKADDVRGPLIYANYGSRADFQTLHDIGVDTTGAIALVRSGGTQGHRASKVKAAELAGFAGCLVYTDPRDDGFLQGEVAPKGRYLPADAVERGSVSLTSWIVGDVLTPGWESKKGLPRMSPEAATGLVKIPSLPLAWRDAQVLLQRLAGAGQRVPQGWEGGVPDVAQWWTGDAKGSPVVRLKNEQDEVTDQPVWNVYGRIVGVEQAAKKVIVGNHRDAWTFGATGPHSGTAVMLEVARIFGDLLDRGWRPLRTIEFMSWDAAEYNLIGSTEYVEKNLDMLREDALAYINLDQAVTGGELHAAGSPVFSKLLLQVLKRVGDPHANASLHDLWEQRGGQLEVLGAGSDYVAFQDLAGTSSLDLRFDGPASPLHTSYDTFAWMDHVGDPGFVSHSLLAQVVGLMLIELADRPIMPFDIPAYAASLALWVKELAQDIQKSQAAAGPAAGATAVVEVDVAGLEFAANVLVAAARDFERWDLKWESQVLAAGGWESSGLGSERVKYVNRMSQFETDLLDLENGGGIPNRTQFKHVVFGPKLWVSHEGELFPAVRDAVAAGDWALVNSTVAKIADIFQNAAAHLID
ncbi:glutamate carboxypeptidase [Niveomyces insectorum RCEF 264]|uniref:Glutamate carboxypeptidase n=1 Tax=Niveomyces insectorum RCEF 264 TaxID=1081102 RepID=A0A167Y1C3_9HYPO|nr:glutamate carboxypeptidase [Niveomyces insectorum RCEF 264]